LGFLGTVQRCVGWLARFVVIRLWNLPASVAQWMRIVPLLDEGVSYRDIEEKLGTPPSTISGGSSDIQKTVCWDWKRFITASHCRS
jgi:uncharacterized protein YerC